jgi:hypothetical protein
MIVNIIRVEDGLVKYRDTYPGGPVAFFADPSQKTLLILRGLYVLQTMLADGVVVRSSFYLPTQSLLGLWKSSNRSIAATSCGNQSGSSSYHACYGAALQVGSHSHSQSIL